MQTSLPPSKTLRILAAAFALTAASLVSLEASAEPAAPSQAYARKSSTAFSIEAPPPLVVDPTVRKTNLPTLVSGILLDAASLSTGIAGGILFATWQVGPAINDPVLIAKEFNQRTTGEVLLVTAGVTAAVGIPLVIYGAGSGGKKAGDDGNVEVKATVRLTVGGVTGTF